MSTYEFLMSLAKGEEHSRWDYPDDLIYDVKTSNSGAGTKIVIAIDKDDDFLDIVGIEEETNDRWVWNRFLYSNQDNYDTYQYNDDWNEGYLIQNFNEENVDRVNEILKYTNPTLKLDLDNENSRTKVSQFLQSTFESEVNDIIYEYMVLDTDCKARAIKEMLVKETSNPFSRFGIIEITHAYKYETTVGILLSLYKMMKAEDDDLKELLRKIDEKYNSNVDRGSWDELEYNVYCDDFDNEELQRKIETELESMLIYQKRGFK